MKKILLLYFGKDNESVTSKSADFFFHKLCAEMNEELQIVRINIREKNIKMCKGCEQCFKNGECCMKDDDMNTIENEISEAEAVFIATPVYLNHLPGQFKNVLDRMAFCTHLFKYRGKSGGIIVTTSNSGADEVISYVKSIYNNLGIKYICAGKYVALKGTVTNLEKAAVKCCEYFESDKKFIVPEEMEYSFKAYQNSMKKGLYSDKERQYWIDHGMLEMDSLQDVIDKEREKSA